MAEERSVNSFYMQRNYIAYKMNLSKFNYNPDSAETLLLNSRR